MSAFADLVRFLPVAGGTTDWVVSSAVGGCQLPSAANVQNGVSYKLYAVSTDLTQWEVVISVYNSGTTTFPRTTVLYNSSGTGTATGQSGAGTKINFSTIPQVSVVAIAEDLIQVEIANSFTATQKNQARSNISAVGVIRVQKFPATATYTPNANMLYCVIECVGAGGGGGGVAGTAGQTGGAGGGGGGSYSRLIASAATIGVSQAVTIGTAGTAGAAGNNAGGAGGDTSLGTLCIGKGGSGGGGTPTAGAGNGGAGGIAGTGDVTFPGQAGGSGIGGAIVSVTVFGGYGGSSTIGAGGQQTTAQSAGAFAGSTGGNYGGGGSGAATYNSGSNAAGGSGAPGYVIVTEFCSQ